MQALKIIEMDATPLLASWLPDDETSLVLTFRSLRLRGMGDSDGECSGSHEPR